MTTMCQCIRQASTNLLKGTLDEIHRERPTASDKVGDVPEELRVTKIQARE